MKTKNIIKKSVLGGLFLCVGLMVSCDDYLTILPSDSIPDENFWTSKADVDNVLAAAYHQAVTTDVTGRILYWGEFRSDDVKINKMDNNSLRYIMEGILYPTDNMYKWDAFYTGISYCNKVLENGQRMIDEDIDPTFSKGEWLPKKAEMKALRALYYFYLVRAYRDVPFVTKTISTDKEALEARKGQPAVQGVKILESLIADLEECREYAASEEAFAYPRDKKGRFTKRSISALLADIYLWQGCLMQNADKKGYTVVRDGVTYTDSLELDNLAKENFRKAIEQCDYVMSEFNRDRTRREEANPQYDVDLKDREKNPYPMLVFSEPEKMRGSASDQIYNSIWGSKNSNETILEIQFDGVNNINSSWVSNYYSSSGGTVNVVANDALFGSSAKPDEDGTLKGFGKTDIRFLECTELTSGTQNSYPILKNAQERVSLNDICDVRQGGSGTNMRNNESQDANFPVYRISDIMLIKAECLARINLKETHKHDHFVEDLHEGFRLVNKLFCRYNPGLDTMAVAGREGGLSTRPTTYFGIGKNGQNLLDLVYRERQREFFAEGKRWFDIVRQAEAINNPRAVLETCSFTSNATVLQARLNKLAAMYSPYYNEECKINPSLKQNEVWDKYTPNSSKPTENKK